jgi:hypothetical protein
MLTPTPNSKLKPKTGKIFTFLNNKSHICNLCEVCFVLINGKFTLFGGLFEDFSLLGIGGVQGVGNLIFRKNSVI